MYEELAPAPSLVWDQTLLAPIIETNERLLQWLHVTACAGLAAPPRAGAPTGARELVHVLLHEWRALDAAAQRRLARCPYLLLDAGFAEPARWQAPVGLAVHEVAPPARAPERVSPDADWVALARRTLLLGWHLARAQPLAARVLLGMSPASAECIAACGLSELEALAEAVAPVAPRWERQPQIWRQLLQASHAAGEALRRAQLRGLQLLAVVAAAPGSRASAAAGA